MITQVSRTVAIKAKLKEEGKASYLNQPEHVKAIVEMNNQMELIRREYQVKDRESQTSAAHVILTA